MLGPMCGTCRKITAALFLVLGALYLLTDLGMVSFWKVNWWSSLFVVVGVTSLASGMCKNCQAMMRK